MYKIREAFQSDCDGIGKRHGLKSKMEGGIS